jgi:hypothetical protein
VPQGKEGEDRIHGRDNKEEARCNGRHGHIHGNEERDEAREKEKQGCMKQKGDDRDHRVHFEPLHSIVKERENPCPYKRCGPHIGLVEEFASPLLNESCNQGAGETEAQTDKPEGIAIECCRCHNKWGRERYLE